jgi:hypothetical protein
LSPAERTDGREGWRGLGIGRSQIIRPQKSLSQSIYKAFNANGSKRKVVNRKKKIVFLKLAQLLSLGFPIVSDVKGKTKWHRPSAVKMCLVRVLFFLQAL